MAAAATRLKAVGGSSKHNPSSVSLSTGDTFAPAGKIMRGAVIRLYRNVDGAEFAVRVTDILRFNSEEVKGAVNDRRYDRNLGIWAKGVKPGKGSKRWVDDNYYLTLEGVDGYSYGEKLAARSVSKENPNLFQRMLDLEKKVRVEGRELTLAEERELKGIYDRLQVGFMNRIATPKADTAGKRDKGMLEWEVMRRRGMNPLGDPEHHKAEHYLGSILKSLDREGQFYDVMREHHGLSFTLRRHDDGDLTAAVRDTHQRMQGPEVVVPPDQIVDVYHYALHHGSLEGWEPGSGGVGSGDVEVDVSNPSYPAGTIPYYVSIPEDYARILADEANKRGIRAKALAHGNRSNMWFVVVPVEQEDEANRLAGALIHAAGGRYKRVNPAAGSGDVEVDVENPGNVLFVFWEGVHSPGRQHQVFDNQEDAHRYYELLRSKGRKVALGGGSGHVYEWSGGFTEAEAGNWLDQLIYKRRGQRSNPAASPEQYRLAQAVLSGTARDSSMPVKVAREIVSRTPARLRSEYSRKGNPGLSEKAEKYIRSIKSEQGREYADQLLRWMIGNSSYRPPIPYFMPVHTASKIRKGLEKATGLSAITRASNPADSAAAMYETFHGSPSTETLEVQEEVHYHGHLAALGDLVRLKITTPSGTKATIDFGEDRPILSSNEDGTQLYIRGGDQHIDLSALGITGAEAARDSVVVGDLSQCEYETEKKFDGHRKIVYFHKLSEESGGPLPILVYDTMNALLSISGGTYRVESAGIID